MQNGGFITFGFFILFLIFCAVQTLKVFNSYYDVPAIIISTAAEKSKKQKKGTI